MRYAADGTAREEAWVASADRESYRGSFIPLEAARSSLQAAVRVIGRLATIGDRHDLVYYTPVDISRRQPRL
jgi:hypothetical protein